MKQPLQIRFLGLEPPPALESAAREKAAKLDRFCPDLMSCRVTVELTQTRQGRRFAVRVDVTLPGHELVVDRVHDEDAHVAMCDAFDDITRQIEDAVRRSRDPLEAAPAERRSHPGAKLGDPFERCRPSAIGGAYRWCT